jgi:hypothetical protein
MYYITIQFAKKPGEIKYGGWMLFARFSFGKGSKGSKVCRLLSKFSGFGMNFIVEKIEE